MLEELYGLERTVLGGSWLPRAFLKRSLRSFTTPSEASEDEDFKKICAKIESDPLDQTPVEFTKTLEEADEATVKDS